MEDAKYSKLMMRVLTQRPINVDNKTKNKPTL